MSNDNPSPATRFKPGFSGNPGGLNSEQIAKRKANRDKAFAIEERLLAAVEKDLTENEAAALDHVRGDVLRLIHTAIERYDGKPQQHVDNTSSDGSMSPGANTGDAVLDALTRKHSPESGTEGA
ncbi:MAG: hypothetical protein GY766_01685 [Herbaspirillum sp.]|uniref:hypothetical protein n=1 Tax=Herbaspirillum sp. TaxID=1890675 RepID=UPI00258E34A6|nr:hypothetical protein [Herbaspirillum sp.]MCP3653598.1 hypothetical protein [Herbaspirillum sp.]